MTDPSNRLTDRTTFEHRSLAIDASNARIDKDIEGVLLEAMLHCEERGDYQTLRGHVHYHGRLLGGSENTRILQDFVMLLVRAVESWNSEAKHGEGTLLNRTSPSNIKWGVLDAKVGPTQS